MDPSEIIKAAPGLVKATTSIAAAIPFTGIVKRMLGPAADELAEVWRDQIRLYRYERQLKCIQKAEKMAQAAGFVPNAVPPKILFPLLEGASMEDDDDLHTMWAALLATASSSRGYIVRPNFIKLLREMVADEAALLSAISEHWAEIGEWNKYLNSLHLHEVKETAPSIIKMVKEKISPRIAIEINEHSRRNDANNLERLTGELDYPYQNALGMRNVVNAITHIYEHIRPRFRALDNESPQAYQDRYGLCLSSLLASGLVKGDENTEIPKLSPLGKALLDACTTPTPAK